MLSSVTYGFDNTREAQTVAWNMQESVYQKLFSFSAPFTFAVHLQPMCSQLSTYTSEGSKGQFMVSLLNTSSVIEFIARNLWESLMAV